LPDAYYGKVVVDGQTSRTAVQEMPGPDHRKPVRPIIGDAGVYLGWQQDRQLQRAVSTIACRFALARGAIFLPRSLHAGVTHHGSCRISMIRFPANLRWRR
jgi:hypothetical protein